MNSSEPVWFNPLTNLIALLIGAALTYFVTWQFENRRERREQKAIAFALIFSLQKICNDLMQLTNILKSISLNRAEEIASGTHLWSLMPISFGWDEEITIKSEEMALLAGTRASDLVVKVQEASSAHRIYTRAATRIGELKLELARSGLAVSASGDVLEFNATAQEFAGVAPIISQLESLSTKLGDDLAEATHQATDTASRVPQVLKDYYEFDHLVTLVFDSPEDE